MARKIWKFQIPVQDEIHLGIPGGGGSILMVANQDEQLTIWMEVDVDEPEKVRTLQVIGTGWTVDPEKHLVHVGSAIVGMFVWHVYSTYN